MQFQRRFTLAAVTNALKTLSILLLTIFGNNSNITTSLALGSTWPCAFRLRNFNPGPIDSRSFYYLARFWRLCIWCEFNMALESKCYIETAMPCRVCHLCS